MSNHSTPQRGASDRLRTTVAAGLRRAVLPSALVAASLALTSCLFLAPDQRDRGTARVAIEATADAGAAKEQDALAGAANSPSCADAFDYLQTPQQLTGRARVWRLPDARTGQEELVHQAALAVGSLDAQQRLVLSGELELPVSAAGARYRLEVELLARGDRLVTQALSGDFSGSIELASGLSVAVDRMLMAPSALPVTDAAISLSSPTVNDGQPGIFALQGITLDPQTGGFFARYENPELPFDDTTRHLVVDIRGQLAPVGLFAGSAELAVVPAGVRQEVRLELTPTGSVPGTIGEQLSAELVFQLIDGVPLRETGTMLLTRDASICPLQAP